MDYFLNYFSKSNMYNPDIFMLIFVKDNTLIISSQIIKISYMTSMISLIFQVKILIVKCFNVIPEKSYFVFLK